MFVVGAWFVVWLPVPANRLNPPNRKNRIMSTRTATAIPTPVLLERRSLVSTTTVSFWVIFPP